MNNRMKGRRFKNLLRLNGEPKVIARGFALGSFIGMLPFPGFQMLISATLASILKFNRAAAIAGVFNTNVATGAFVFAFNYWIGCQILGTEPSFRIPEHIGFSFAGTIFRAGSEVFAAMLLGGLITGIVVMFIGYYVSFFILQKYQKKTYEN